jgi:hypothetical protein
MLRAKAGFQLVPLTDRFEITRAQVRNCGIFATLNPLKLQVPVKAITLRFHKKPTSDAG